MAPAAPAGQRELLEKAVHDLKNPLAVVRASLEWLEVELSDREDAVDAVRDAFVAAGRLTTIVDDLEALARLETSISLDPREGDPVPLVALVESLVPEANARLLPRGIEVVATKLEPASTTGNGRLLARAMTALLETLGRAASSGARINVTIEPSAVPGFVEIGMAVDGGVDDVEYVDPLQTSGLGVFVALRVIEAHGGAHSVTARGTKPQIAVRLRSG